MADDDGMCSLAIELQWTLMAVTDAWPAVFKTVTQLHLTSSRPFSIRAAIERRSFRSFPQLSRAIA